MPTKMLLILLFCCAWFLPIEGAAQCNYLDAPTIKRLASSSYASKIERLYQKGAKQAIVNKEEGCKSSTFVACQNYISDEQWHWAEIITFNSCDKILTYSTSNQEHFNAIKKVLTKKYEAVGNRTYSGLVFEVYQDKKSRVIEVNEHPNQDGVPFYLINIIRVRGVEGR